MHRPGAFERALATAAWPARICSRGKQMAASKSGGYSPRGFPCGPTAHQVEAAAAAVSIKGAKHQAKG